MLVLWLVGACAAGGDRTERIRRWPVHRQQGDARFAELEKRAAVLEAQTLSLTKRIQTLEDFIARVPVKTTEPPTETTPTDPAPP